MSKGRGASPKAKNQLLTRGRDSRAKKTNPRPPAPRLIPVENLRPLTAGGRTKKRRPCPDCRYCQGCSQDRCRLCRKKRPGPVKLSLAEQIALYDKINRPKGRKPAPRTGVEPRS